MKTLILSITSLVLLSSCTYVAEKHNSTSTDSGMIHVGEVDSNKMQPLSRGSGNIVVQTGSYRIPK